MIKKFLITLILIISCSYAKAEVINKIEITGNTRISDETVKIYGGVEANKDYSEKDLNTILNNLNETNFFEDIKINISNKRVYGGGVGGYTRNMKVYLKYFKFNDFEITPCFHSIRGEINLGFLNGPIRLFYDLFQLLNCFLKLNIKGVHIMAQYRGAIVREFFIVLISNIFNKPVLYEIKAGSFESTYNSKNGVYKFLIKYILKKSKLILVEGKTYMSFLKNKFNKESTFFPNVIPSDEIPSIIPMKLDIGITRILFIGFAYEGKGVFELYDACEELVLKGHKIKLTIVGEIHENFKNYITKKSFNEFLNLKGKLNHNEVLEQFKINDVYCYP